MARSDFGFQIGSALATNYLTDSKYIRAGYTVVDTIVERDQLPIDTGNGGVIVSGSICFVNETKKCYRYIDSSWQEEKATVSWGDIVGNIEDQTDLKNVIDGIKNIGHFCAMWDASNGIPLDELMIDGYEYKIGDYFRISVAGNKIPKGDTYIPGEYDVILQNTGVGSTWYYDGLSWKEQAVGGGSSPTVIFGYYHEGSFYADEQHTYLISPVAGNLYFDVVGKKLYLYDGDEYVNNDDTKLDKPAISGQLDQVLTSNGDNTQSWKPITCDINNIIQKDGEYLILDCNPV